MKEEDFYSYEAYEIITEDGKRYIHPLCYCWINGGREDDETGQPLPYSATEYTFCFIPLDEYLACGSWQEKWDMICDAEAAVQQYEGDYTWEDFIAEGYGDPDSQNGVALSEASFKPYLNYKDITEETPNGLYHSGI